VAAGHPDVLREGVHDVILKGSPLHSAASRGQVEALQALLEAGASVNALDGHGDTALMVTISVCLFCPSLVLGCAGDGCWALSVTLPRP
jgi:Ankyrin repeats (many copies)